jgi:hypothetical protein
MPKQTAKLSARNVIEEVQDALQAHLEQDRELFSNISARLGRIERTIWTAFGGIAILMALLDNGLLDLSPLTHPSFHEVRAAQIK